jgi:hypothetical protein
MLETECDQHEKRRWIWKPEHDGHQPCNRTDSLHYYSLVIMFFLPIVPPHSHRQYCSYRRFHHLWHLHTLYYEYFLRYSSPGFDSSEDTILLTHVEESQFSRFSSTWYPSDCQSVPVFPSLFACDNLPVIQCNVHLSILLPHCSTKSCTVNSHGIRPDGNLPATSLSNQPPSALVSTHGNENALKLFDPLLRLP